MKPKTTRLDDQGRVIIPSHIRNALTLRSGNCVEVELEEDGTIRLRPTEARCSVCGESVDGKRFTQITTGPNRKLICYDCAEQIASVLINDEEETQ